MGKVSDFLLTLNGEKTGLGELDRAKSAVRTVFALRGFGEFGARWGIVDYGKELTACLRRTPSYEKKKSFRQLRGA